MSSVMSENGTPLEIEKKYLIKMPDIKLLERQPDYSRSNIEQAYIKDGSRIRKRSFGDTCKYYKTFKQSLGGITRIEIESEITEDEYKKLMDNKQDGTEIITKERHCFDYKGKVMELDVYSFCDDKATLEIELQSEDETVEIPDFAEVIKDVSQDKAYSNYSLAKGARL